MLRSITFAQFQAWRHFCELEPFGERRMDYRFASIVQILANINRDSKKKSRPYTLEECAVVFGEPEEDKKKATKQPWQVMKEMAKIAVAAFSKPEKT